MNFFKSFRKRNPKPPEKEEVKLVSLHIPKTAGTSFRKTLKIAYGESGVVRLDIPRGKDEVRLNNELLESRELPAGIEVVHGHFNAVELLERFPELKGVPIITWVRHPVERVISNYFYLEKRLREELDEEGKNLNILSKMQRSLIEYARSNGNRNRQQKFLAGIPPEEFAFIGVLEHYAEDLQELGLRMGWQDVAEVTVNVTAKAKPVVSDEVRLEIEKLNAADMALYEQALHLRSRRKEKPQIELVSIHVPKTAGTSFYHTLREVYGGGVTESLRRTHVTRDAHKRQPLAAYLTGETKVVHGHIRYEEIAELKQEHDAKVICWLRDPVERVISNYHFFKNGLTDPARNRKNYELNKHRKHESLLTYATMPENCNVMSKFLTGIDLADIFFIGFTEDYENDLNRLSNLLGWPEVSPARLNTRRAQEGTTEEITAEVRAEIARLNAGDAALYSRALELKENAR